MTRVMVHRGPDSAGFLDCERISLGMRRLKIIDLAGGDQPIFNETGSVGVMFNGEVYNFEHLLVELQERGHHFRSRCDTEVIVHAYEEWGIECVERLHGMFAFAIFDGRDGGQKVFIARDRLGIKPLYYGEFGGALVFASEVRSLLAGGLVGRNLSLPGLYSYLCFGGVQEPLSMIEGVLSLPPASWLLCALTDSGFTLERGVYWQPPAGGCAEPDLRDVASTLSSTVNRHLISDVPIGAFLSGGLDSGAIAALASRALTEPLRTFTLGFDNWPYDEREEAGATARRHSTAHSLQVISEAEFAAGVPKAVAALDQPSVDAINTWFVAGAARESGLTVALSGVGGDELFAGYPSFRQVPALQRYWRVPTFLAPLVQGLGPVAGLRGDRVRKLAELVRGETLFGHAYFTVRSLFSRNQALSLLSHAARAQVESSPGFAAWKAAVHGSLATAAQYDEVAAVSWLELSQYMLSTLLRDTDQMSMAHSLEVRVPFVDHILLEHILPVRGSAKLQDGSSKPLLVAALGDLLPSQIVGKKKRTFTLPFERWLGTALRAEVESALLNEEDWARYGFEPSATRRVWESYERGETNWARPWALRVLMAWMKEHVLEPGT